MTSRSSHSSTSVGESLRGCDPGLRRNPTILAAESCSFDRRGGEVVNLEGEPVDAVGHQGPFVAAIDAASRQVVLDIASDVMGLGA